MTEQTSPAATRQSWPTLHPLPVERARLIVERTFSTHEYTLLARGVIPEHMEDRWFVFLEGTTLFFHRSWSGYCIFEVTLVRQGDEYAIGDVLVNRDTTQYSGSSDSYDRHLLLFLINNLVLGQHSMLPLPQGVSGSLAVELYHHQVAGAGHKQPHTLQLGDLLRWVWDWLWWLIKRR
jgi:hypothetical protein